MHFILALQLAVLLLFFFRPTVEEILGASLTSLFSKKALLLLSGVLVAIFTVSVIIPVSTLQRIPLATIFRNDKRMKQSWKLALLFVQFGAAAFLLTLTASVSKQYNYMVNDHPGYDYRDVAYVDLSGVDSTRKKRVEEVLRRMNISHRAGHFPNQLSGGQQQRVAIARAVIANPKLILADEPTGNLDSKNGKDVMDLLTELNREGTTIVMVTHSQHDASFAHRIVNLFD